MTKNLKVYLLGAGGTGKTSFAQYHTTGGIPRAYISTMGIRVDTMGLENNGTEYVFNLFDMDPGHDLQTCGCFDGKMWSNDQIDNSAYDNTYALAFYENSEACQSLTDQIVKEFRKKCGQSVRVISVWNKSDLQNQDPGDDVEFLRHGNDSVCKISLKNNENCLDPLSEIMRMEESSSI